MDHDKPQAISTYADEAVFSEDRTVSPLTVDVDYARHPSLDEPVIIEEKKERRGEALWRTLSERHINMIAFSGVIGNGLFLQSGNAIAVAGPGGAVLSFVLMGTVISSVISSLGEMTALMPVNGPIMEFPRRFLDRGVGLAVGWMYWFAYCVLAADQLVAFSNAIKFQYDDGRTFLNWKVGVDTDPAVWVSLGIVLVISFNMLPVRIYGELEYIFGCIKLTFICMLIVLMLIFSVMTPRSNAYYTEAPGTKYWNDPYSFFWSTYDVRDEAGFVQRTIKGSIGAFLNMWTTIIGVIFSYTGMDIIAATASESKSLSDAESMKMAVRKLNMRVVTLYCLTILTASFAVPRDHPFINGEGSSASSHSLFIIAAVEAGLPHLAHFFNAMFVFSAFSCAINTLYVASRVLHTMALLGYTGPEWITKRLRATRTGVPVRAVLASGSLLLVGYVGRTGGPGVSLGELSGNCTVSCLIVYMIICATYLCFYRTLEDVKRYGNASEAQTAMFDRNHPRYPYKSHGQWLKAAYGGIACTILVFFNGIAPFFQRPFDTRRFVADYIGIPVFIILILGYKIYRHGFQLSEWGPERSNDLRNTIQASSDVRKGRLELPDNGFTKENVRTFFNWIWVWLK